MAVNNRERRYPPGFKPEEVGQRRGDLDDLFGPKEPLIKNKASEKGKGETQTEEPRKYGE